MDTIYHAVKNLLKSLINLFAAILELFTDLINWLASCLRNFYPHISGNTPKYMKTGKEAWGCWNKNGARRKAAERK